MQVSIENVGALGRRLTVRLPATQLEASVHARVQDLRRNARIKGFRPGKVPQKVIEQRFGGQIRGEALSEMIGTSLQDVIEKEKLRPAMQPAISTSGRPDNGEIEYIATFEVMPELGPIDVSALEIVRPVAEVTPADIDQMVETLRLQRRSWTSVERAAQDGDMMLFEYSAEVEGARHPQAGADRVGVIVGSGVYSAELESLLVGRVAGEEFSAELKFAPGFTVAALAGKAATARVHVIRVQEPKLPEVDEAFAATFGVTEGGVEQFRRDVRANLERELKGVLMERLKAGVVEKLVDAFPDLELPQGLIEADARLLAQRAGEKDGAIAAYLAPARRRVAASLLIAELARQNSLRLDSKRVGEALATIASTYEEPGKVVELYRTDPQLMTALQNRVMEDQVVEWVAEHAQHSEHTLGFNEVMRPGA